MVLAKFKQNTLINSVKKIVTTNGQFKNYKLIECNYILPKQKINMTSR